MKEVLKLLFHLSLKDITTNCCFQYINPIKSFAVKACYNDLLWYCGTPNRFDGTINVERMATDSEIYFVAFP